MGKTTQELLNSYAKFFESLSPERLKGLEELVEKEVVFQDPFNDLQGIAAFGHVFQDMFKKTEEAKFHVLDVAVNDSGSGEWQNSSPGGLIRWKFVFRLKGRESKAPRIIEGTSYVRFSADGKVAEHRDYWDPALFLYEKLPVIGFFLKKLRKAFRA